MAKKDDLRKQRAGTVINNNSKPMETAVMVAVRNVAEYIRGKFHIDVDHKANMYLKDVAAS